MYTAPLSAAGPTKAPYHQASASASKSGTPSKGSNSIAVIALSIGAGVVIIGIIFLLVICSCSSYQKPKPSMKDPGMSFSNKYMNICNKSRYYLYDAYQTFIKL